MYQRIPSDSFADSQSSAKQPRSSSPVEFEDHRQSDRLLKQHHDDQLYLTDGFQHEEEPADQLHDEIAITTQYSPNPFRVQSKGSPSAAPVDFTGVDKSDDQSLYGHGSEPPRPEAKLDSVHVESTAESLAEDNPSNESSSQIEGDQMKLILCRVGLPNKPVTVGYNWTTLQLKQHAFTDELAANKNVRLIFQGKLLSDDRVLTSYGIKTESYVHCAITDPRPPEPEAQSADVDLEDQSQDDLSRLPAWMIAEHQMAMMQPREGTGADLLLGFVMGFVLGVLALLWMWQRVPRKQKIGILFGLVCNLFFSFIRINLGSNTSGVTSGARGDGEGGNGG